MIDPLVSLQNYMENHHFLMGKSTMASFHSYVNVYQRLLQWWIVRIYIGVLEGNRCRNVRRVILGGYTGISWGYQPSKPSESAPW
jgi:hypothetical protein